MYGEKQTKVCSVEVRVNSINKYSKSLNAVPIGTKAQRRVLYVILLLLLVAVVALSIAYLRAASYRNATQQQLSGRVTDGIENALVEVNGMTGGVQANSSQKLAKIRQYVYSIDQMNQISIRINGEAGRLVPQDAVSVLYEDLDTYEVLVQTATTSTLDIRYQLQQHLTALNEAVKRTP